MIEHTLAVAASICTAPIGKKKLVKQLLKLLELIYYGVEQCEGYIDPQWLELVISRIS